MQCFLTRKCIILDIFCASYDITEFFWTFCYENDLVIFSIFHFGTALFNKIWVYFCLLEKISSNNFLSRPDIFLKCSMYHTQAKREMIHLWINSDVSSAKVWAFISSSVSSVIPLICLILVILMRSISTDMMKIKGEIMSPCGTPCSSRIFIVRCTPITMWATLSVKNNFTQSIQTFSGSLFFFLFGMTSLTMWQ